MSTVNEQAKKTIEGELKLLQDNNYYYENILGISVSDVDFKKITREAAIEYSFIIKNPVFLIKMTQLSGDKFQMIQYSSITDEIEKVGDILDYNESNDRTVIKLLEKNIKLNKVKISATIEDIREIDEDIKGNIADYKEELEFYLEDYTKEVEKKEILEKRKISLEGNPNLSGQEKIELTVVNAKLYILSLENNFVKLANKIL